MHYFDIAMCNLRNFDELVWPIEAAEFSELSFLLNKRLRFKVRKGLTDTKVLGPLSGHLSLVDVLLGHCHVKFEKL